MLKRWWRTIRKRRLALSLAGMSGVLYFVGFCGFDQYYLAWFCLVPVLWALDDATLSGREALLVAWTFGLVTHLGGYTWIIGMLRDFGYLPWPLALLGYFVLCLGQSTLLAAWGWGVHRLVHRHGAPLWLAAPVVMVLAEWLWPALFPSYLSSSQYEQILFIQTLDLWGPLGLSFIVTLASSTLYATLAWRWHAHAMPRLAWPVLVLLIAGDLTYGWARRTDVLDTAAHADRFIRVGVVQTNMGIYEKSENPREGLERHRDQSLEVERQGAQLIVWPESGYYYGIPDGTSNVAREVLGAITTPLIFGGLRVRRTAADREIYNTAFLADAEGNLLGTYDKTYLLAFGEYLPLGEWLPWLYDLSPHSSRFSRGTHTRPLVLDGVRYGMLICYEDVLPGFTREVMEHQPHVLVNITNDAWFGKTREPRIHLALSTFRAVEHRRFLVRATNTGISAFVDPTGSIVAETPVFARANLVHDVAALEGATLYAQAGDLVPVLPCLAGVISWLRQPLRKLGQWLRRGRARPKRAR
ncbi:MAG: apolipoprotein N-acyltransferase [Deltaproteobacteria bacterium]|nr:apolipoprotein N-acyltransferase [Deltaproteobacteria bacterium]